MVEWRKNMEWRKRTMDDILDVKGTYILDMFIRYQKNILYINRKYQRKLVWTLEEKQDFINTILHHYPVPIFLLVKYKLENNEYYQYDVIDGLQRLDAIFSYIKNEFPAKYIDNKYYYFNVNALADAEEIIKQENIKPSTNTLDFDTSRDFLNYTLPVTTTEVSDKDVIDIFKRINSTGRKLSKQDLRQAGTVSLFADLVRKTSCYVRGDITEDDLVSFRTMPALSLSNKKLEYKINIYESFWLKNKILTANNIRISRDEEIIAKIYGYILLGDEISPSYKTLNSFYEENSKYYLSLDRLIEEKSEETLMRLFSKVYSDINKIFDSVNTTFSKWMFKNVDTSGKSKVFQVLFLSLYELRKDNYFIKDYVTIANTLKNIGDSEFHEITNEKDWNAQIRNTNIRRAKSILQPKMVLEVPSANIEEWELLLEKMLSAYGSEQQMYDFKLGITTLKTGIKNKNCVSSIVKTLTAMANTQPDKIGTIIIGVSNDLSAANDYKNHYCSNWVQYKNCYITGIKEEIKKYYNDKIDNYTNFIKSVIKKEPIREDAKNQILNNFKIIEYQSKILLILTLKNMGYAYAYDKEYYERHGSNTESIEIGSPSFDALMSRTLTVKDTN